MALDTNLGQLYFPFMLDLTPHSEYILDELPYMKQCHAKFEEMSHQHIPLNDFLVIHYCNPDSLFYGAETYYREHNPQHTHDGYILSWKEYNELINTKNT